MQKTVQTYGLPHLPQAASRGAFGRPCRRLRAAHFITIAVATATLSCTSTRNFLDPDGPRYLGSYAVAPAAIDHPAAPAGVRLRVVTFNIQHARHVDRALELLRSEPLRDPDLLLLQEMDAASVERIARELRLNYVYFPSAVHPSTGRLFGTSILSPWRLAEPRKIVLPHPPLTTRVRRAVTTAVMHRDGLRIRVYSVHLPAPASIRDTARREQVRIVLEDAAKSSDPVIIAGDFNDRNVGPWFRQAGFVWLTDRLPGTSRGLGFWWSFDHVFVRGLRAAPETPAAGVVNSAGTSDHRPVWVRVERVPPE